MPPCLTMLPQDPPQVQKSLSKLYVLETSPSSSVITKPISWLLALPQQRVLATSPTSCYLSLLLCILLLSPLVEKAFGCISVNKMIKMVHTSSAVRNLDQSSPRRAAVEQHWQDQWQMSSFVTFERRHLLRLILAKR